MITKEVLEAIKEGKAVQVRDEDLWIDVHLYNNIEVSDLISAQWRIKPEPVKYSVDIWLDKEPKSAPYSISMMNYILGHDGYTCKEKTTLCNKHYRITVEEVVE